uniref:Uncharacterized protein n=1 Tax=Oryza glumipatula TaxID=40148 RepID=A0A0D9Y368_9ORYZ
KPASVHGEGGGWEAGKGDEEAARGGWEADELLQVQVQKRRRPTAARREQRLLDLPAAVELGRRSHHIAPAYRQSRCSLSIAGCRPSPCQPRLPLHRFCGGDANVDAALLVLGLATISAAITLATTTTPLQADLSNNGAACYSYLALAVAAVTFLAGVAQVVAFVWVSDDPRHAGAAGNWFFVYASVASLVVAVGALAVLW